MPSPAVPRRSYPIAILNALLLVAALPGSARAGVAAGRIDVDPSGGSLAEKPVARVVAQSPGLDLYAASGNRGDWTLGQHATAERPAGQPFLQTDGVVMASPNELLPLAKRGGVEVGGGLTVAGVAPASPVWVAGFSSEGNGVEANVDFAFAFFRFAEGWSAGHVAKDGSSFLASGNLPNGSTVARVRGGSRDGEVRLALAGVDALDSGMLFTVAAGNGDNVTAVGPLPDGSGWHIRVADEGNDYRQEELCAFSFVYLPYGLPGLTGGWIGEDGRVLAGTGGFGVRHAGPGRYEIVVPERSQNHGLLLVEVAKMNPEGVEDNAIAWAYDPTADRGAGAFVVETYDQPGFQNQDVAFYFAYIDYDNRLEASAPPAPPTVEFACADTWADSLLRYRDLVADQARPADTFRPFFSGTLTKAAPPCAADLAVEGVPQLWLVTDPVDTSAGDVAAWGDAAFVLRDGSLRRLSTLTPVFASALTARPVVLAGRRLADGLVVQAPALLCYAVPADAVRFRALGGLDETAGATASVQLKVVDRHDRWPAWDATVRAAIEARFPTLMARLHEHLDDPRLRGLDLDAALPRLRASTNAMVQGLASLTPDLPPDDGLAAALRRYEACGRRLDEIARIEADMWSAAPVLAQLMDYPASSLLRLRSRLEQVLAAQPANAAVGATRRAQFEACEASRGEILLKTVQGDRTALERLPALAEQLLQLAEWTDRARGWTTYRGDNERSAVSRERLTWPLQSAWTHTPSAPPEPAWPPPRADNPAVNHQLSPTLTYDRACHVVAADGRLFYGDSAGDAVVCLAATSGAELWRFPTEGPVRLAPALWSDRVYAACDDGWLYCLQAATGDLLWRYRAGPDATRLPGNQRLISAWPVRCGICIEQGTVYFGAGVFPTAGTYLCALDAHSGKERWKQTTGCVPQGFLLLSPTRLFVPTGRTPFQVFERQTGKPLNRLGQSNSWGKDLPGGTSALIVNRTIATGPGEGGVIHLFDEKSTESLLTTEGLQVVVDGLTAYVLMRTKVVALQRRDYLGSPKPARLWESPCRAARTMLKVGNHLLVGGDEGLDIVATTDGAAVGHIPLAGAVVEGLAWHDGRLFASALDGRIVCLRDAAVAGPEPALTATDPKPALPVADAAPAEALVAAAGRRQGYALFIGADQAALALAVARHSDLQCILADTAAERCRARLVELRQAGAAGRRLTVHHWDGTTLPYRPYLFNLVVAGPSPAVPAAELFRVLRPYGGLLVGPTDPGAPATRPPGEAVPPPLGLGLGFAFRRGAVPGAGNWTHGYADAGNTACSSDALAFGAFDLLWFGRPGPQFMYERHVKAAAPLCDGGLLFVNGMEYLAGVDAYNGTVLWERHEPGSGRMAMLKDCGNVATADGRLYAAVGNRCLVIEGLSGRTVADHPVPGLPLEKARWDYIAVAGDLLLGSATRPEARMVPTDKADYNAVWYHNQPVITSLSLFALDRASGRTAWTYAPRRGAVVNPTLTVLDGRLCFVESTNAETLAHATGKIPLAELFRNGPELVALDLASGKECWRVPIELSAFVHSIYMSGRNGVLVLSGSRHAPVRDQTLIQYQLVGVAAASGKELWRNDNTPSRAEILNGGHGEQTQHPAIVGDVVYGPGFARRLQDGTPHAGWAWEKSPACASLSASEHCAFSRQNGVPTAGEFASGKQQRLTTVTRPGCLINTLPAGGIVVLPEASSGCTCPYPVQTSLALCPAPAPASH